MRLSAPGTICRAVRDGVHQQRVELVQADQLAPLGRQTGCLGISAQHPGQVRRAEQRQHGQVGESVSAVRRRVDQDGPNPACTTCRRTARCRPTGRRESGRAAGSSSKSPSGSRAQTRSTSRDAGGVERSRPAAPRGRRAARGSARRTRPTARTTCSGKGCRPMKPSPDQSGGPAPNAVARPPHGSPPGRCPNCSAAAAVAGLLVDPVERDAVLAELPDPDHPDPAEAARAQPIEAGRLPARRSRRARRPGS